MRRGIVVVLVVLAAIALAVAVLIALGLRATYERSAALDMAADRFAASLPQGTVVVGAPVERRAAGWASIWWISAECPARRDLYSVPMSSTGSVAATLETLLTESGAGVTRGASDCPESIQDSSTVEGETDVEGQTVRLRLTPGGAIPAGVDAPEKPLNLSVSLT